MALSQYSHLYKNRNWNERKLTERRELMLQKQKQNRSDVQDDSRRLSQFLETLTLKSKRQNHTLKNYVQLSEWLHECPDDLEQWFLVPCPKGQRCIAVANNGSTKIFSKYGMFMTEFHSALPGDIELKSATTILDCFSVKYGNSTEYMVLDVMYYKNTEMLNCETSFRFFWIGCKLPELNCHIVNKYNDFAFKPLKYVDCSDDIAVDNCLTTFPMWGNENIVLDGLLFYHKDSSYVHGITPLVGWLLPFMVNEVLGFCTIHPKYLEQRPDTYTDAKKYIEDFNAALKQKQRNKRAKKCSEDMEEEPDKDYVFPASVLNFERRLEVSGETGDDYEKME